MEHQFDTIIIGAGLAGLRAAIEIGEPAEVRADVFTALQPLTLPPKNSDLAQGKNRPQSDRCTG